jgi:hypothetical protein
MFFDHSRVERVVLITVICILVFSGRPLAAADLSTAHDYEAQARALYKDEPDYAEKWPVEFHTRIVEGLLFDLKGALFSLDTPFYDDTLLKEKPLLLEGLKSRLSTRETTRTDPVALSISPDLFADPAEIVWGEPGPQTDLPASIRRSVWTLQPAAAMDAVSLRDFWKQYLAAFRYVDRYTIKVKKGRLPSAGVFQATTAVEFAGRTTSGWRRDYGKADLTFTRTPAGWRISRFAITEMTSDVRDQKMVEDVTSAWLAPLPNETQARLRVSSMSDTFYRQWIKTGGNIVTANQGNRLGWFAEAHSRVSVVDIDGDRWDDLVVWDILGKVTLLRNIRDPSGNRAFEDATDRFGLNFRDVSSLVFADLNNDGMIDIVVGRWAAPSEIYLGLRLAPEISSDLMFVPANVNLKGILPSKVEAVAVADMNRDAYLDLYFSTSDQYEHSDRIHIDRDEELAKLDSLVDRFGPRNVLLVNLGKADFSDLTKHFGLELQRTTLAASFGDFNSDGYPDLVLANDFGPTSLYLNDKGDSFHDISSSNGTDKIFFGMGTSWGDYDNDGDLDLYITAMQSTAGQRITSDEKNFSPDLSPTAKQDRVLGSRGNILLRNDSSGKFVDISGDSPYSQVRNANWAYGAQFLDFDNDCWLDIFSPNGHITFPRTGPSNQLVRDY